GSAGTDHGTAGAVFLAGPGVRGGVLGTSPSLTDLAGGEPKMTTDFRRVYAATLTDWLRLPAAGLGGPLEPGQLFREGRRPPGPVPFPVPPFSTGVRRWAAPGGGVDTSPARGVDRYRIASIPYDECGRPLVGGTPMRRLPVIRHRSANQVRAQYRACRNGVERTRWHALWRS